MQFIIIASGVSFFNISLWSMYTVVIGGNPLKYRGFDQILKVRE